MLQAIYELFMQEAKERGNQEKLQRIANDPGNNMLLHHDCDVVAAQATLHALSLAYISLAYTVEGLAKGIYQNCMKFSKQFFPTPIANDGVAWEERKAEFANILLMRNKVTAHVAAVEPWNDSTSTRSTSALRFQFGGTGVPKDLTDYIVGGPTMHIPGQTNTLKGLTFSLKKEHPKMASHLEKWEEMIMGLFDAMGEQCPITCKDKDGNEIKITTKDPEPVSTAVQS